MVFVMLRWLGVGMMVAVCAGAGAQACPRESTTGPSVDSAVMSLRGLVVYHDDLRQWFELRVNNAVCGTRTIQLVEGEAGPKGQLEQLRGCQVEAKGRLSIPATGYYSAELYLSPESLAGLEGCRKKALLPDYSKLHPAPDLRAYRVTMRVHYGYSGPPMVAVVTAGRRMTPWQEYASYTLTGGFVFYGMCAAGFEVWNGHGTRAANAGQLEPPGEPADFAMMDPETAAERGVRWLTLRYDCGR